MSNDKPIFRIEKKSIIVFVKWPLWLDLAEHIYASDFYFNFQSKYGYPPTAYVYKHIFSKDSIFLCKGFPHMHTEPELCIEFF